MEILQPSTQALELVEIITQDFIFALSKSMFDPSPGGNPNKNPNCGRKVIVNRGANSVLVTCEDRCDGCKSGEINLSSVAFDRIVNEVVGRVKVSWEFIS